MRLFLAALAQLVGVALVAAAAFVVHPAAGLAVAGASLAWLGTELRGAR